MTNFKQLQEALTLLKKGYTHKETAQIVGVTERTVKNWQARYIDKVGKATRHIINLVPLHTKQIKKNLSKDNISAKEISDLTKATLNIYNLAQAHAEATGTMPKVSEKKQRIYKALNLLQLGYNQKETAQIVGVQARTVGRWRKQYEANNPEKLIFDLQKIISNKLKDSNLTPEQIKLLSSSVYMLNINLKNNVNGLIQAIKSNEISQK